MIGPPRFPTGCDIDGDLGDLVAGRPCAVTLRARTRQTARRPVEITIDRFPPGVTPREVMDALSAAAEDPPWSETHPRLAQDVRFPLQDIMDISDGQNEQITCKGEPDATAEDITRLLRTLWPLGTNLLLQLSAPLPALLREWVASASGEDATASLHRLDETV